MMTSCGMNPVLLSPDTQVLPAGIEIRRIVVFFPEAPVKLLDTLLQVASILEHSGEPLPMLILSRSPVSWLWYTLLYQVVDYHLLERVRAATSDLPISTAITLLQNYIQERYPTLKQMAHEEMRFVGKNCSGLTRPELNAVLGLLNGCSANAQAKRCGISRKTLYTQRTAGLKKMVKYHPQLANRFPGSQTKEQEVVTDVALSAFEREFVDAIQSRLIFLFFSLLQINICRSAGLRSYPAGTVMATFYYPGLFYRRYVLSMCGLSLPHLSSRKPCKKSINMRGIFISL